MKQQSTQWQRRLRSQYGPWAVVTGASDGIGREFAVCLARAGVNLVLVARRGQVLDELANELAAGYGITARYIAADLATETAWNTVANHTSELDVGLLVASAGFGTSGRFIDADLQCETNMVDVNCRALLALSHQFGRRFAAQGRGGIVLMSSLVGFQGVPFAANYAATKAYVQSFAEALRWELAPCGVDVLACAPGPIHSGFAARANMQMGMGQTPADVAQAALKALGRKTTVRPGWLTKVLDGSLSLLPRAGRVRIMKRVMGGMTAHQRAATGLRGGATQALPPAD